MEEFCFCKNGIILVYKDENTISVKKCAQKRFLPNSILDISIEDFRKVNIKQFLKSLQGKSDGVKDLSQFTNRGVCWTMKECEFLDNPEILDVHVNLLYLCNASCTFCSEKENIKKFRNIKNQKEIYFETLERLKGNIRYLTLTHGGEPFLFKSDMIKFLNGLNEDDFKGINIASNGANLDDDLLNSIKNSKVPIRLEISVHAGTKETRKRIMGLDDFEQLKEEVEWLKNNINGWVLVSFVKCDLNNNEKEKEMFKNSFNGVQHDFFELI